MFNRGKWQKIEKYSGEFVYRDGLEGRCPQEEEEEDLKKIWFHNNMNVV